MARLSIASSFGPGRHKRWCHARQDPGRLLVDRARSDAGDGGTASYEIRHDLGRCSGLGRVPGAENGTLAIMAGGREDDVDRVRPVASCLSRRITHMGDTGAGQVAKLCNQVIVSCTLTVVAEAIALAEKAGIDAARLPEALAGGFADSIPFQLFAPRMVSGEFEPPLGAIWTMLKDADNARTLADAVSAETPMTDLVGRDFPSRHRRRRSRGRHCDVDQSLSLSPHGAFEFNQPRYTRAMLEIMIEQWKNLDGSVDYPWSVWRDGVRVHMGGVLDSAETPKPTRRPTAMARLGSEPRFGSFGPEIRDHIEGIISEVRHFDHLDRGREAPLADLYEDRLQMVERYEAAGIHCYHLAEHHATSLGMAPSPGVFLAAVAQRTSRILFGPLVYILPLHDPAPVDRGDLHARQSEPGAVSARRRARHLDLRGGSFRYSHTKIRGLYDEALEVLLNGLTSDVLNHDGRHYHYANFPMELRPVQKPHPAAVVRHRLARARRRGRRATRRIL